MSEDTKSVRFSKSAKVVKLRPFPESVRKDLWITPAEIRARKARDKTLVSMLKKGTFVEDSEASARGLEPHLDFTQNKQRRVQAVNAGIEEQKRQKEEGVCRPDRIATVYQETCINSRNIARRAGQKDELDAQEAPPEVAKSHFPASLHLHFKSSKSDEVRSVAETETSSLSEGSLNPAQSTSPRGRRGKGFLKRLSSRSLLTDKSRRNQFTYGDDDDEEEDGALLFIKDSTGNTSKHASDPDKDRTRETEKVGRRSSMGGFGKMLKSWSSRKLGGATEMNLDPEQSSANIEKSSGDDILDDIICTTQTTERQREPRKTTKIKSSRKLGSSRNLVMEVSPRQKPRKKCLDTSKDSDGNFLKKSSSRRDLRSFKTWSNRKLGSSDETSGTQPQMLRTWSQKNLVVEQKKTSKRNIISDLDSCDDDEDDMDPILPPAGTDGRLRGMLRSFSSSKLTKASRRGSSSDPHDCDSPTARRSSLSHYMGNVHNNEPLLSTPKKSTRRNLGKTRTWSTDISMSADESESDNEASETSLQFDAEEIQFSMLST